MDERESLNAVVFKTKVAHFRIKNTPLKDTNCEGKFKRGLSFFCCARKAFGYEIVFNNVFFTWERKISFTAAKF